MTVVAEYPESTAASSRYCRESLVVPELTSQPEQALSFLLEFAQMQDKTPVVIPTADPDLMLLSGLCDRLSARFHLILPKKEHVDTFADKARFRVVAEKYGLPVPRTFRPSRKKPWSKSSTSSVIQW